MLRNLCRLQKTLHQSDIVYLRKVLLYMEDMYHGESQT